MAEELDKAQARDHIEMVERILAESSQRLCFGGEYFIVWGIYSGIATADIALIDMKIFPAWPALAVQFVFLLAAIGFSIWRGRANDGSVLRRSLVQREFHNILWLALGLALVANFGCFNLFRGIGNAAIWSFAETLVLLFIGMHGNRRAQVAGIVLLASMIAANFVPWPAPPFVLAAGMAIGYGGFGIAEMLARD
jgi:hypothetical protein